MASCGLRRIRLVEPLMALFLFAGSLPGPLISPYIYRRLCEDMASKSGFPFPANMHPNGTCYFNGTTHEEELQKASSRFDLSLDLIAFVPAFLATLFFGAYSDRHGRRFPLFLTCLGDAISNILMVIFLYRDLPLWVIYVLNFITSFFGGTTTLLGSSFAYVADVSSVTSRNARIAFLEMLIGGVGFIGSFISGYVGEVMQLYQVMLLVLGIDVLCMLYVWLVIEETVTRESSQDNIPQRTIMTYMKEIRDGFRTLCLADGDLKKRIKLILMLITFMMTALYFFGAGGLFARYQMNEPLLWTSLKLGYFGAMFCLIYIMSYLGVHFFSKVLPDILIAVIGMTSFVGGMVMISFAKTDIFMYLVNVPMMFAVMPAPVLRSMLSKLVNPNEQGAVFSAVACGEMISALLASIIFNNVYAATVSWYPGFAFLLAAAIVVFPLTLLGILWFMNRSDTSQQRLLLEADAEPLHYGSIQST
uniref:lysosomal proton-coupled steroid conjugate and bile acid symporter SLC46A3-like isoform X2 n=1 Tax=Myxine glutinosa TaxID=7769 RepID=UPI00358EFAE8